jgi:hypothetical protein
MLRLAAIGISVLLIVSGVAVIAEHEFGTTQPEFSLGSTALPPEVAAAVAPVPGSAPPSAAPPSVTAPDLSGTPIELIIPFASSHHPQGLTARITADRLTATQSLFVPHDPRVLSWASQDAAPGASRGTAIVTGHINYVINGTLVNGALADLPEYALNDVGQTFTVVLADDRRLNYQVTAGTQYNKDQLAAQPQLREELYDQQGTFGRTGDARSGRLLLVSCGGAFDNATGNYQDNVFLYALPVG